MDIKARMKGNELRIKAVSGVCSQCGRMPSGGCETGIVDSMDEAHAFCDYECLAKWNVAHGLTACGDIIPDNLPWPGDVKCSECGSQNHNSSNIAYFDNYNERLYQCKDCGHEFTHWTK